MANDARNSNDAVSYGRSRGIVKEDFYFRPVDYTASDTFKRLDYSKQGVSRDRTQILKTAGYPQLTQVQHTAFNVNDLLQLDISAISANDLIWVANKSNNDWDVFRITNAGIKIAELNSINEATQMEITFTGSHGLSAGTSTSQADFFAISNSEESTLNGVYQVVATPSHKTVIIDFTGNFGFLPTLEDGSTADSFGNISKFISVRLASMDNVNDLLQHSEYNDRDDAIGREGDKVFADSDSSDLWQVYEKVDPYKTGLMLSPDTSTASQEFGHRIVARNDGRTIVVSAPGKGQGEIHFLFRKSSDAGTSLSTQATATMTENDDNTSRLGESLSISTDENYVVAGAPYTNTLDSDGSTRQLNSGLIKVYQWNPNNFEYGILNTISPPTDGSSANDGLNFGWQHKISAPGENSLKTTPTKYLFVSAPGHDNDQGRVYMYKCCLLYTSDAADE